MFSNSNQLVLSVLTVICLYLLIPRLRTDPMSIIIPYIGVTVIGFTLLHDWVLAAQIGVLIAYIVFATMFPVKIDVDTFVDKIVKESSLHVPAKKSPAAVEHFWSASTTLSTDESGESYPVPGPGPLSAANLDQQNQIGKILRGTRGKSGDGNDDGDDDDDEDGGIRFNLQDSLVQLYQQLTPDQIQGISKDTQELMQTQKQLLATIQNMAPVLKDGKRILDSFKDYFGPASGATGAAIASSSQKDIMKQLSALTQKQ
jgi:hypothetical protein